MCEAPSLAGALKFTAVIHYFMVIMKMNPWALLAAIFVTELLKQGLVAKHELLFRTYSLLACDIQQLGYCSVFGPSLKVLLRLS